jgi:hypothetical protein
LSRQRYNAFGEFIIEPKAINRATVKDLCLFIRNTGLSKLCCTKLLGLHNKP